MTAIDAAVAAKIEPDIRAAWRDYVESFKRRELWITLAWFEIKIQYKRSVLGPFWITLSTGIAIATIGPIYSRLMGSQMGDYFSYLATSLILWNFIAGVINTTDLAWISAEGFLKDSKLPLTLFVMKEIFKNLLMLAHTSVILVILFFFFTFHINIFLFLLCAVVVIANLFWVGLFLAVFCTRFRDIAQIVTSLVQVAFFVTPVMWQPHSLGGRHFVVTYNPFYYLMDIFRSPLLYGNVDMRNLMICVAMAVVGNVIAFLLFASKRKRVTYWL